MYLGSLDHNPINNKTLCRTGTSAIELRIAHMNLYSPYVCISTFYAIFVCLQFQYEYFDSRSMATVCNKTLPNLTAETLPVLNKNNFFEALLNQSDISRKCDHDGFSIFIETDTGKKLYGQ